MNVPQVITDLVQAQNQYNSRAYADCFAADAVVEDEGHTYVGHSAIQNWIEKANQEFQAQMKPLSYNVAENILEAEISGTFKGSPLILQYHFEIHNEQITRLKII